MANTAAERSEKATSKRRQKEREQGNVPKSQDLTAAFVITIGVAVLGLYSGQILSIIQTMLYDCFTHLNPKDISNDDIMLILMPYVRSMAQILVPFLLLVAAASIVILRFQVGHLIATDKIKLKFDKLSPMTILNNAKKQFNPFNSRNMVELLKSFIKLLIVFFCGFSVINGRKDELFALIGLNINSSFAVVGSILTQMLMNICLAMLAIGLFDKKYQDYEYEKSIKMSKQEIKDELKDTEGDPKIKAKIRGMQIKMMRQRMLSNVAKADVVVTNPTHYAIALEYDRIKAPAPKVVAKGVDFLAFKIREIAQNNNIPIVENPPLARTLYKLVPIDGIIPSEMFVAVAEVLAYVYNRNKQEVKK